MPYAKTERRIEYRRVSYWERRRRCDELGVCFECGKVPPVEGRLRCVACARANKVRVIRAQMKRSRAIAIGERNDRLPPVFPDDTPEELERIRREAAELRAARTRPMDPKPSRVPPLASSRRTA